MNDERPDNVARLGVEPPPEAPPPVSRPSRLHGLSISGLAFFALTGIVCLFLSATVDVSGDSAEGFLVGVAVSALGFLVCAAVAVFTAARDTYATGRKGPGDAHDGA